MELEKYRKAEDIVELIDRVENFLNTLTGADSVGLMAEDIFLQRKSAIFLPRHIRLKEKLIEAVREELDTLKKEFEEL